MALWMTPKRGNPPKYKITIILRTRTIIKTEQKVKHSAMENMIEVQGRLGHEEILNKEEAHLLEQLKKELSLQDSQDAVPLVSSVLHALRETLPRKTAEVFMHKLPGFMKKLFASNWRPSENRIVVEHLDELVTLVMERDQKNSKSLFKSELQALSVILYTLKKIYCFIDFRSCEGISWMFYREVKEASEMAVV
jgi:uncharacterized protein (DUF2267 family)